MAEGTKRTQPSAARPARARSQDRGAAATKAAQGARAASQGPTGSTGSTTSTRPRPTVPAPSGPASRPTDAPKEAEEAQTRITGASIATTSDQPHPQPVRQPKESAAVRWQTVPMSDDEPEEGRRRKVTTRLAQASQALKKGSDLIRTRIAALLWLAAVLAAIALAAGALLIALDANRDNALVTLVLNTARSIDGPFWRIFEFTEVGKSGGIREVHDVSKEVLVNWGLAAVAYLVAGRILDRVIRP
jgi:hypothetical protein